MLLCEMECKLASISGYDKALLIINDHLLYGSFFTELSRFRYRLSLESL